MKPWISQSQKFWKFSGFWSLWVTSVVLHKTELGTITSLNRLKLKVFMWIKKSEKCEARVNRSLYKFSSTRAVINWEADEIFCTRRGCDFYSNRREIKPSVIKLFKNIYFHNFWKFHGQRSDKSRGRNSLRKYRHGFAPYLKYICWNWIPFAKKIVLNTKVEN